MQQPSSNKITPVRHILVVEDDADLRQLNAAVLTQAGYKVDTAEDGDAAWEAIKKRSYDLMVTDNRMPKMTGVELLRKLGTAGMLLPVILASGTMDTEETSLQSAIILMKPYTSENLLAKVRRILEPAQCVETPPASTGNEN